MADPFGAGGVWETHYTQEGHAYFYNTITQEVRWDTSAYGDAVVDPAPGDATGGGDAAYYDPNHVAATVDDGHYEAAADPETGQQQQQKQKNLQPAATLNDDGEDFVAYDVDPSADLDADDPTVVVLSNRLPLGAAADDAATETGITDVDTAPGSDPYYYGPGRTAAELGYAGDVDLGSLDLATATDDDDVGPLPDDWEEIVDDNGTYYWNPGTGESRWDRPRRLLHAAMGGFGVHHHGGSGNKQAQAAEPELQPEPQPELEEDWTALKDDSGYTYYWNQKTGASQWDAPLRRVAAKLAVLGALGGAHNQPQTKKKELTAEEVVAEHQRNQEFALGRRANHLADDSGFGFAGDVSPLDADDDNAEGGGDAAGAADDGDDSAEIPCPADFDAEEWAAMPRDLQREMADGAGASLKLITLDIKRDEQQPTLHNAADTQDAQAQDRPANAAAAADAADSDSAAATEPAATAGAAAARPTGRGATTTTTTTTAAAANPNSGALGTVDGEGKWQQEAPPMSAAEIHAAVRAREEEYKAELVRLRVKDLRQLVARLGLPTDGLRPVLTQRLVAHDSALLRQQLEAAAKEQAVKYAKANRARLSMGPLGSSSSSSRSGRSGSITANAAEDGAQSGGAQQQRAALRESQRESVS
jgi:hypothetical protein